MTPESRKGQLLAQRVGDELVIYDERTHEAHRLNATAALVWDMADGQRSVQDLAVSLRSSIAESAPEGVLVDEADSEELVRLAVSELERAGLLLERGLPSLGEPMSRRQMMAVTAALVPVVASILAPTPAMAQTGFNPVVFNGTYNGAGAPDPGNNPCKFNSTDTIVVLNVNQVGAGTMNITHVRAGVTFIANVTGANNGSGGLTITGPGSGGGFTTQNNFNFVRVGQSTSFLTNGTQTITGTCGTFPFQVNATRS